MRLKKVMKFTGPIVAGLVTLLVGHSYYAFADIESNQATPAPACSSLDYINLQQDKATSTVEMTPSYALSLSEAFITRCPDRPEVARVSLTAAQEALDAGNAEAAYTHFHKALARGASFDQQARMDFMTMLLANGRDQLAWDLRDEEVALWLAKLDEDGLTRISSREFTNGTIYALSFDEIDPVRRERLTWVAVPNGPGFPASISLSSEVQLIALARLRVGAASRNMQQIVYTTCADRDTLSTTFTGFKEENVEKLANGMLMDYLAAPESLMERDEGDSITTCLTPERMLVAPDPATSIPTY